MSDTPKRFNWSSAGMLPATNGAFVHERDLADATKERDHVIKCESVIAKAHGRLENTVDALRAQLSALQSATNRSPRIYTKCPACHSDTLTINDDKHLLCTWIDCPNPTLIDKLGEATPQDHAQAIEIAKDEISYWYANPDEVYANSPSETLQALVSTILTPQSRKEGELPCATINQASSHQDSQVVTAEFQESIRTTAAKNVEAVASNAAHTSAPSEAAPTQDHLAGSGEVTEGFNAIRAKNDALSIEGRIALDQRVAARFDTAHPTEATATVPSVSEAARELLRGFDLSYEGTQAIYGGNNIAFVESILTQLTGDQAKRIAELEEDKVRLTEEANRWRNVAKSYDDSPSRQFYEELKQMRGSNAALVNHLRWALKQLDDEDKVELETWGDQAKLHCASEGYKSARTYISTDAKK